MTERLNRRLIIDSSGTERMVPFPVDNAEINYGDIRRPTLTSYEDGLEWNRQAQEHADKALNFTQEYAIVKVEPRYSNRVYIHNFSDTHFGHHDTDYDLLNHDLTTVYETPDVFCIFGWNILDAAIPAQFPDGVMWSGQTAQEQVYTFHDMLVRLNEKNKIVGAIGDAACHEGWMKKKTGWMVYRELFDGIDVPLLLNGGYLDIQVRDQVYRTALFHKIKYWSTLNKSHGGNRAMDRLTRAQIVFTSHYHQAETSHSVRFNPPFSEETGVVSSGTYKIRDRFSRGHMGKEGERGGQGVMLWGDNYGFETIFSLDRAVDLLRCT